MTTHGETLSQATVEPTEPPTEDPKNPDQTDWDCSDDDFDSNFVEVTIHNISQGGTILEKSDNSNHEDWWHSADTSRLVNPIAFCWFLDNYDQLLKNTNSNDDDDCNTLGVTP